jgi:hypothetical protein
MSVSLPIWGHYMRQPFPSTDLISLTLAGMLSVAVPSAAFALPTPDDGDAPATAKSAQKTPAAPTESKPTGQGGSGSATEKKDESPARDGGTKEATAAKPASTPPNRGVVRSYSRASDWQLEFKPGLLRLYVDASTGDNFWYFTYKVVNRTGAERLWAPRFEFFSERGEIKISGREVPTRVTDQILELLGNPLLEDQNEILGDILIGEENAKEGLVVWPAGDADVNELTVFATGASGRVRKVPDALSGELKAERWTLRFNYHLPGDAVPRGSQPIEPSRADDDVKEGAERRPDDIGVWLWR